MHPVVISDVGSCHMQKLSYAKECIDVAYNCGVDVIKFQLFQGFDFTRTGNIELPREWWPELLEYAGTRIKLTSSAFDWAAVALLNESPVPFIKFAYSQRDKLHWMEGCKKPVMVSCDVMSKKSIPEGYLTLYCIPEYPVRYQVDFEGIFTRLHFDGFSSHCLGIEQDKRAVDYGARYIEKHMTLDHKDITCPDSAFALPPKELDRFVTAVKHR